MKRVTFVSTIVFLGVICLFIIILPFEGGCEECLPVPVKAVKFFICGLVLAIGGIYFTKEFLKTETLIFDVESYPLLETDEAVDGVPFAGEGVIETKDGKVLNSPFFNISCVYFHFIKEKLVRSDRSSYWEIVENVALFLPFYVVDERGKLEVDLTNLDYDLSNYKIPLEERNVPNPQNSEIDCDAIKDQQILEGEKYRVSEYVLRPGTKVFVYGMVSRRDGKLVLHEAEGHPLIISKKSRDQYVEEFYKGGNLVYFSHFLVSLGYTFSLLSINYLSKRNPFILFNLLFIGNFIILGSSLFSLYNRIITLKNRALNALSNIEVELKRRADLISTIVEVVKGYAKHEKEIQNIIADARAEIMFSKDLKEEKQFTIPSLVAVIENYPELKASENFLSLMKVLVDTEERIAYSRAFYNRSVRKYNTIIKQIPFLFISWLLDLKEMDFVTIHRGI